jgi:hypothetical protein
LYPFSVTCSWFDLVCTGGGGRASSERRWPATSTLPSRSDSLLPTQFHNFHPVVPAPLGRLSEIAHPEWGLSHGIWGVGKGKSPDLEAVSW